MTVVIVSVTFVVSGCLEGFDGHQDGREGLPSFGVGIEIPDTLPPPGPFIEGSDLMAMENFLIEEGEEIQAECGRPEVVANIKRHVQQELYYQAIEALFYGCRDWHFPDRLATQAIRDGAEREKYDELEKEAREALNLTKSLILTHLGPANPVEAQLMAYIMSMHNLNEESVEKSAPLAWEPYENGTQRDQLQLHTTYLQFTGPRDRSETLAKIIERYPWGSTPCHPPDLEELADEIQDTVDKALALASHYGHDVRDEQGMRNTHYNIVVGQLVPEFEVARDREWWPRLLSLKVSAEGRLAYWESFSAEAWPTFEEAEVMLAEFRNHTRSIWTEQALRPYISYFNDSEHQSRYDWYTDTSFGPPGFLRVMSLYWPFEGLDCSDSTN